MVKKSDTENNLVVQSNTLVEATYSMTSNEIKVFEMCLSQIDSRERLETSKTFTLTVDDVVDLFYTPTNKHNAYRDLRAVSERFFERKALIRIGHQKELLTRFVQSIKFHEDEEKIDIKFADDIIPYVSQLESHFTKYRIKFTKNLSSIYSHRIYQFLVCWAGQGLDFKEISLDELRSMLTEGKYSENSHLKKYVLEVAKREINAHTDFSLDYLMKKRRNTFNLVQFKFSRKPDIAKAEEVRLVEQEKKASHNATMKAKRIGLEKAEAEANAIKMSMAEFDKFPEGTIFKTLDGATFRKTANGVLLGDRASIVPAHAVQMLSVGSLSMVFA